MFEQRAAQHTSRHSRLSLLIAVAAAAISTACTATAQSASPVPVGANSSGTVSRSDLSAADGYIPQGQSLSPFDNSHPAVTNLAPELRSAVRAAAQDAAEDGIDMMITTGWRSERFQRVLLDEAIEKYGSKAEALKWVATAQSSNHVTGEAVDIGPTAAASWLSRYGNEYGLCRTYANEMWHYQLATQPGGTCPDPLPDATAESSST